MRRVAVQIRLQKQKFGKGSIGEKTMTSRATLVLQKFSVHQQPQPAGAPIVEIVGRSQGAIAFILTTMGFSASTKFTVTNSEVCCESSSLFGQRFQFIPLRSVGTLGAGLHKPVGTLMAAAFLIVLGLYCWFFQDSVVAFAIAVFIAAILLALYYFSKKFFLEVHPKGGPGISLLFKPSAIEGVPIDIHQALAVVAVIRDVVTKKGTGEVLTEQASSPPPLNRVTSPTWSPSPQQAADSSPPPPPELDVESQARAEFAHAKHLFDSGQRAEGLKVLEDIVRDFPNTHAGRQAEKNL